MTTFRYAIMLCGLSQQGAADYLDVSINTVKSWCSGRGNPPAGVWTMLAGLFDSILEAADNAAERMAIDGIDARAFNSLEVDLDDENLPEASASAAGAMALLMKIGVPA